VVNIYMLWNERGNHLASALKIVL